MLTKETTPAEEAFRNALVPVFVAFQLSMYHRKTVDMKALERLAIDTFRSQMTKYGAYGQETNV